MKKIISTNKSKSNHWVGNGFPVRSLFSYHEDTDKLSPFLLFDYAGPADFPPTKEERGVGDHPHRGFETVTIVYDGEVEHGDSVGNIGKIGPGDVQWMTAASGIIHREMHGRNYQKKGGRFEMVQLWVNLPAKDKMSAPKYQEILKSQIPTVDLPQGAGQIRVIAGDYQGNKGPAHTFTPINVWDTRLKEGTTTEFKVPSDYTTLVAVLSGHVKISGSKEIQDATVALLERTGDTFNLEAKADSKLLVLNGQPINEPVIGYGPFVMNRKDEIEKAVRDFETGRFVT